MTTQGSRSTSRRKAIRTSPRAFSAESEKFTPVVCNCSGGSAKPRSKLSYRPGTVVPDDSTTPRRRSSSSISSSSLEAAPENCSTTRATANPPRVRYSLCSGREKTVLFMCSSYESCGGNATQDKQKAACDGGPERRNQ